MGMANELMFDVAYTMSKEKPKLKRLSKIMQENKHFDRAIESYIDQLEKKRDRQNLENKMVECKKRGWPKDKLAKIFQWKKKASEMYSNSMEISMEYIRHMADEMTDQQFYDLKEWIKKNPHSVKAWNKSVITADDSLALIKAKVMHLAFMRRSPTPVNVGEIINSQQ